MWAEVSVWYKVPVNTMATADGVAATTRNEVPTCWTRSLGDVVNVKTAAGMGRLRAVVVHGKARGGQVTGAAKVRRPQQELILVFLEFIELMKFASYFSGSPHNTKWM